MIDASATLDSVELPYIVWINLEKELYVGRRDVLAACCGLVIQYGIN
jgi:hypothetical protein